MLIPALVEEEDLPRGALVTAEVAARLIGVSDESVRRWIADGKLPAERREGTQGSRGWAWAIQMSEVKKMQRERAPKKTKQQPYFMIGYSFERTTKNTVRFNSPELVVTNVKDSEGDPVDPGRYSTAQYWDLKDWDERGRPEFMYVEYTFLAS